MCGNEKVVAEFDGSLLSVVSGLLVEVLVRCGTKDIARLFQLFNLSSS